VPSKEAFDDFSNRNGEYVKGPVSVFVYDLNGVMLADSQNPAFRGQNLMRSRDAEGKFITKRIIDQAKDFGKGWISIIDRKSYKDIYVEKVRVADGDFVVGAGYWPSSKPRVVHSMVEKALNFAKSHPIEEALHAFTIDDSDFLRGDVHIFVYDLKGVCWASGIDKNLIWTDITNRKDNKGRKIIDKIASIATSGGGWYEYKHNNATRLLYINAIELEEEKKADQVVKEKNYATKTEVQTFIIGSGYYP
jgi:polar amino acid transport system substrate-binding protein